MDDVLNLIRSIVEEMDDPPEVPPDSVVRDAEQVEAAVQERRAPETFADPAEPANPEPSVRFGFSPVSFTDRAFAESPNPAPAVRETSQSSSVQPYLPEAVAAPTAPGTTGQPSPSPGVEVVTASSTAGPPASIDTSSRMDMQSAAPDARGSVKVSPLDIVMQESQQAGITQPHLPTPVKASPPDIVMQENQQAEVTQPYIPTPVKANPLDIVMRENQQAGIVQPYIPTPVKVAGEPYDVAQTSSRPREMPADIRIMDPLRVAAASVTADLNVKGMPLDVDPTLNAHVVDRQVTPEMRIVTMIPNGFPVDVNHALAIHDRDIQVPNDPFGDFPDMAGEFPPLTQYSTEQMVASGAADLSILDDMNERNVLP